MMQLEFGGRKYEIPAGELAVGSDPAGGIVLAGPGVKPRHAILRASSEDSAVIQRGAPDAETLVNGVRLGANLELYNTFNANTVLTESATYRDASLSGWRIPTSIMPPRFVKLSLQMDF